MYACTITKVVFNLSLLKCMGSKSLDMEWVTISNITCIPQIFPIFPNIVEGESGKGWRKKGEKEGKGYLLKY